jgi:flagellar FliJ protein
METGMSALKGVLLAIEHATLGRDALAKAAARVERNMDYARTQMAQLQGYAADTDTRWTGTATRGVSVELMRHQYQFMDRLQQAITMQSDVLAQSAGQLEQAKARLLQAEVRLLGLNQILKTRQTALLHTQRQRQQRHTDEFAAMQYARNRAQPMSGEKHDD